MHTAMYSHREQSKRDGRMLINGALLGIVLGTIMFAIVVCN